MLSSPSSGSVEPSGHGPFAYGVLYLDTPHACTALEAAAARLVQTGWTRVATAAEVPRLLSAGPMPGVVAVGRAWPLSHAGDLSSWPTKWQAVRFLHLLGPWCEGEGRTGTPIVGYERVFWDEFAGTRWSNPQPQPSSAGAERVEIGVVSRSDETVQAISSALADCGARVTAYDADSAVCPSAVIVEATQLGGREADQLARLRRRVVPGTPITLLIDFPRAETVEAAFDIGANWVLRKPYERAALLRAVGLRDAASAAERHAA